MFTGQLLKCYILRLFHTVIDLCLLQVDFVMTGKCINDKTVVHKSTCANIGVMQSAAENKELNTV